MQTFLLGYRVCRPQAALESTSEFGSTLSQLERISLASTPNEDAFLTVAEIAETLKINQQTVRNWIDQGSLPAVRVGRRVRIFRSDFDRFVQEGRKSGRPSSPSDEAPSAADFWSGEPVGRADPSDEDE